MRQLLKEMKLAELPAAATSYHGRFLKVLPHMNLIKSRPLIFLSPGALETAALCSCCLYTTHSLWQRKLKKPRDEVREKVSTILGLVKENGK